MYIKSIELDGFKSYAKKQPIDGFHPQFNAITGFNGTGKSNILDGICFLLGLSKLENIRARNMADLVYKQGQSGITKAVVTIVFDNSDKSKSPLGMQDTKEIIVRRLVQTNQGRGASTSYTLNGQAATNNRIHDFFRSVGLNVNNPHFLIMQGRITKVLNMKPDEILGMLEEAAGTKMYEQKKKDAEKTLFQKDLKLTECSKLIDEELDPKLEKMRQDRVNLVEVKRMKKQKETLVRKLDAFIYWGNVSLANEHVGMVKEVAEQIDQCNERIANCLKEIGEKEVRAAAVDAEKRTMEANPEVDEELRKKTEERVNREGDRDEVVESIRQIEEERTRKKATISKDEKLLEKKRKEYEATVDGHDDVERQQKQDVEDIQKYRLEIEALSRGMMTNEQGEQVSVEQKIQESRTETAQLEAAIKTAMNRKERLKPRIENLAKQAEKLEKKHATEMTEIKHHEAEVKRTGDAIAKLNFDEKHEFLLKESLNKIERDNKKMERDIGDLIKKSRNGRYDFVFRDPPIQPFDRKKDVFGTVATLFTLKPNCEQYDTAVEMACGGYISQVVVSTQDIARSMVENRVFQNRKTLIPIKESRNRNCVARLEPNRMARVKMIATKYKEKVEHILDVIDYPEDMQTIMENIFGSILVAETLACAKEIAYHNEVRARVVTKRGDDVKPNGVMSGGHNESEGSIFEMFKPIHTWRAQMEKNNGMARDMNQDLIDMADASKKYHALKAVYEESKRRVDEIRENLKNSELGVVRNDLAASRKELEEVEQELVKNRERFGELEEIVKQLEQRKNNDKSSQEKEKKLLRKKLEELEARASRSREDRESASRKILAKKAEVDELEEQIRAEMATIDNRVAEMEQLKKVLETKNEAVRVAMEIEMEARKNVDAQKQHLRQKDDELKRAQKQVDSARRERLRLNAELEQLEKEKSRYEGVVENCNQLAQKQRKKFEWIAQEEQHFGKHNTEYDFRGFNRDKTQEEVEQITKKLEILERQINTKVSENFDAVEAKLQDIKRKQSRVNNDKNSILHTINVLDEKKVSEIKEAHERVNADFGNIFSTLLPGAFAQLTPPEGKSVLDGLEVKVSFNGQMKESLQELSGGQRSLVALSLILAMLKFKPAPLYILDEVDAALDLSHTANIGKMIKTHFTNSQFVVVSLKEGMFGNADVLFTTKFHDGSSHVDRTVNHQPKN